MIKIGIYLLAQWSRDLDADRDPYGDLYPDTWSSRDTQFYLVLIGLFLLWCFWGTIKNWLKKALVKSDKPVKPKKRKVTDKRLQEIEDIKKRNNKAVAEWKKKNENKQELDVQVSPQCNDEETHSITRDESINEIVRSEFDELEVELYRL